MRPAEKVVDVSKLLGLKTVLAQGPVLTCNHCKNFTIASGTLDAVSEVLAKWLVESADRLTKDEARFLRKFMLLTQKELAARLSVARLTVVRWEEAKQLDYLKSYALRALVSAWMKGNRGTEVTLPDRTARGLKETKNRTWNLKGEPGSMSLQV